MNNLINKKQNTNKESNMDGTAVGLKLGMEILKKTTPTGLAWVSTYLKGKELLLLGPGGVGKSSISDYLEYGVLEPEDDHNRTHRVKKTSTFSLKMGKEGMLKLNIKRVVDTPGQVGPTAHAELVKERRPHAIIIVMDINYSIEIIEGWIIEFCEHLDELVRSNKKVISKLKSINIILNKTDKISDVILKSKKQDVKKSVTREFKSILGPQRSRKIPCDACISIQNDEGSILIDNIIRKIAKEFQ